MIMITLMCHDFNTFYVLQFTVTLQSEEHIPEECRPLNHKSLDVTHTSHCSYQEHCLHTKKTHIVLPVPITATPEFVSDLGKIYSNDTSLFLCPQGHYFPW